MKIAYATQYDPKNNKSWSGTVQYIAKSLEEQDCRLDIIAPLKEKNAFLYKLKQVYYKNILRRGYLRNREPSILKGYARQILHYLSSVDCDVALSPETLAISFLECSWPLVFWVDATFSGMLNYYPRFINLSEESLQNGHMADQLALDKCLLAIYSSDWAAKTAIDSYQINPNKVKVVPFGANIECNRTLDDIKALLKAKPTDCCKLLFIGVDWHRKGGAIALDVAKELNRQGLPTELTIVGCQPVVKQPLHKFVKSLGFISKSEPKGLGKINQLLSESHFLILPSRAECFGVVLCEASSFGLPSLATSVGGIPTVVQNNLNGRTFSLNADVSEYCQYISHLFENYSEYENLALSSFHEYDSRLNWSIAGKTVKNLILENL